MSHNGEHTDNSLLGGARSPANDTREQILNPLDRIVARGRAFDFQSLAAHALQARYPDFAACEWQDDGGEDAVSLPEVHADGRRRSLACSHTATLSKITTDLRRILERH